MCEWIREKLHGRTDPDLNWAAVGLHTRFDEAHANGEISDALHDDLGVFFWAAALLGRDDVKTLRAPVQQAGDLLLLPRDQAARNAGQQLKDVIESLDNFEYDNAVARLAELERSLKEPIARELAPAIADCRAHVAKNRR